MGVYMDCFFSIFVHTYNVKHKCISYKGRL